MKTIKTLATILMSALIVVTTGSANAQVTNEELEIGISQEFENFNPLIMTMLATSYMYRMVGRTLTVLDENGKWVPQLATQMPSIENGAARIEGEGENAKVIANWEIRKEAKWGDGTPLTCHDVEFAWRVAQSDNVSIGEKETYTRIEKIDIDKENPKKCTFTYKKAYWDFARMATFYIVPKHLEEAVFKKHGNRGEGYEQNSNYTKNPTNPGLFNGPYLISEVRLGSHVAFTPNPHFYGEAPKIKRVVVKLIPNTGTLEANLRSGTIDMISVLGMSFDQALAFEKKAKAEKLAYNINFQPSLVYEHIDINLDDEILKDQKVRQALVYGVNRNDLTKSLFDGRQEPAIHNLAPIDPWFTKDPKKIKIYPPSRRTANKMLEEAGWKMGKDGFRYKDGKKLQLTIMTTAGARVRELVQVYLKDQWKNIGVDLQVKNEPARVFFGETTRKRKFPHLAMYAWVSSPESNPRSTLSAKSIPSEENGWSGQNHMGWENETVTQLIEDLDWEMDPKKREDIMHKILKAYTEEVPVIPLYYRSDVSITPANLKGYKLPGHQFSSTNHIEKWDLGNGK